MKITLYSPFFEVEINDVMRIRDIVVAAVKNDAEGVKLQGYSKDFHDALRDILGLLEIELYED